MYYKSNNSSKDVVNLHSVKPVNGLFSPFESAVVYICKNENLMTSLKVNSINLWLFGGCRMVLCLVVLGQCGYQCRVILVLSHSLFVSRYK